jgi:KipI family sensor histidine kinase inhibitor
MYQRPTYLPAGDRALSVEFGNAISRDISSRVRAFYMAIEGQGVPGVLELVPTYRAILVYYDPLVVAYSDLVDRLESLEAAQAAAPPSAPAIVEIPTVYGGEYGPDLEHVSQHCGLPQDEVVRIHAGTDYLIYMMGFTPGFPYLGGMSERIATPRLQTPRTIIPAGSVGIAEKQTGVYPIESPGGWQLIGRTPVRLFEPGRDPPVMVEAGDYLRFVPVTEDTFKQIERQVRSGSYRPVVRAADGESDGRR